MHGPIVTHWKIQGDQFRLRVAVPANATATVDLPVAPADAVRERHLPAHLATGVRLLRGGQNHSIFQIGSGQYEFFGPWIHPQRGGAAIK